MKTCSTCKIEKPANTEHFHRNKRAKDGLVSECKECRKKKGQKRYQENKEKYREHNKKYYQENKEWYRERSKKYRQNNKEYYSEYRKKHYQENKEYYEEYGKKHYQENKEWYAEYNKEHYQENREYYRLHDQKRKARVAQLPHTLTVEEWSETLEYFNNECAYCGDSECNLAQEHVIPVSKGGGYIQENIIPACKSCNSSKKNKNLEEWYVSYEHYNKERLNKILDYVEIMEEI